jgi:hypothetical protein
MITSAWTTRCGAGGAALVRRENRRIDISIAVQKPTNSSVAGLEIAIRDDTRALDEADAQIPLELRHPFAELRLGLAARARRGGKNAAEKPPWRTTCAKHCRSFRSRNDASRLIYRLSRRNSVSVTCCLQVAPPKG